MYSKQVSHMIGDRGLEMLAQFCKHLRRLRVGQSSADALFNVYVGDISNTALKSIST